MKNSILESHICFYFLVDNLFKQSCSLFYHKEIAMAFEYFIGLKGYVWEFRFSSLHRQSCAYFCQSRKGCSIMADFVFGFWSMAPPVAHGSPESRAAIRPTSHPSTRASKPTAPKTPPTPPVHFFQLRSSDPALIVPPPLPPLPAPSVPSPPLSAALSRGGANFSCRCSVTG